MTNLDMEGTNVSFIIFIAVLTYHTVTLADQALNQTYKVDFTFDEGADNRTCGFSGSTLYQPVRCTSAPCRNDYCEYRCPADRRDHTLLNSYTDPLRGAQDAVTFLANYTGKGYDFSDNATFTTVTGDVDLMNTTVCFWIYPRKNGSDVRTVFDIRSSDGREDAWLTLTRLEDNDDRFQMSLGSQSSIFIFKIFDWDFKADQWTHVTIQVSRSSLAVFTNGTSIRYVLGLAFNLVDTEFNNVSITVGSVRKGDPINCILKDFRIYKGVLSNREIRAVLYGEEDMYSSVQLFPACFCPAEYPNLKSPTSSYCYSNDERRDLKRVLRFGEKMHPIQYVADGDGATYWLGQPGVTDITLTLVLSKPYEIAEIRLIFHLVLPDEIYISPGNSIFWHVFSKKCPSFLESHIPCSKISSSTAVTWLRDDKSATRADYYVTSRIMIRLAGSSQIDPLSQYHGIHDIEVYAGCSCNGRGKACQISSLDSVCAGCQNSYGSRCQHCIPGYFLPPTSKGDLTCQSCQCSYEGVQDNIKVCHKVDGICSCNSNDTQEQCDICNENSGQCQCKKHVTGFRCNECVAGYFNLTEENANGCHECQCNLEGHNKTCDVITGECSCLTHVIGSNCSLCEPGYFARSKDDFRNNGCQHLCDCNPYGTVSNSRCGQFTGQCQCKTNITGLKCDECANDGFYLLNTSEAGSCVPCECDTLGLEFNSSGSCDVVTGQCPCKKLVESRTCDRCRYGHWGLNSSDVNGCMPCDCYDPGVEKGTTCDPTTGQCKCRSHPNMEKAGRQCNPFLESFEPASGPFSGGKPFKVRGGYFNPANPPNITIGNQTCIRTSWNATNVICTIPRRNNTSDEGHIKVPVKVLASSEHIIVFDTGFTYERDPVIYDIRPMLTILSGGIIVTIKGDYFQSVVDPQMHLFVTSNRTIIQATLTTCTLIDGTTIYCETPMVDIDNKLSKIQTGIITDKVTDIMSNQGTVREHYAIVRFDFDNGVTDWRLELFFDPEFANFTDPFRIKVFRRYRETTIKIQGNVLLMDSYQYNIKIGSSTCKITDIQKQFISCKPPTRQPLPQQTNEYNLPEVTVSLGSKMAAVHVGYLQYYNAPWDDPVVRYVIIGACVFVFTIALIVMVAKRCKKEREKSSLLKRLKVYIENPENLMDSVDGLMREKLKECLLDPEQLTLQEIIGKGHFGQVQKGIYLESKTNTAHQVAVKTIKDIKANMDEAMAFLKEASLMSEFDHPHVLSLIGVVLRSSTPLIVLPYMEYGDLRTYISDPARVISLRNLLEFGVQIAQGMCYLTARHFVHRDLAARNCMLNQFMVVKIADFGLSRDIYHSSYYRAAGGKSRALPIRWMAPESIVDGRFCAASDVWAFGITLWELVTRGALPYPDIPNHEIRDHIIKGYRMVKPTHAPDKIYAIMVECWAGQSASRPSFHDLINTLNTILHDDHTRRGAVSDDYDDLFTTKTSETTIL